jgi:hypothetical protein
LIARVVVGAALGTILPVTTHADSPIRLGHEFVVNTYTPYPQWRPDVAAVPDGRFVVVWERYSSPDLRGQRFDTAGVKAGGEFIVTGDTQTGFVNEPSVAAAADGSFVVVWEGYVDFAYPAGYRIVGQRHSSTGARVGELFVVNTTPGTYYTSSVATAPDGSFVVAWTDYGLYSDGSDTAVRARRFDSAGAPLGSDFVVNTYTTGEQADQAVARAADGSFIVVWADRDREAIVGRRYDGAGVAQGSEFDISATPSNYRSDPSVAAASDGRFVVVWRRDTGADIGVRRYDSVGSPQGGEFVVNSYTTGNQHRPDVTIAADGSFVVAWANGSGYSGDDIFARRFDSAGAPVGGDFQVNELRQSDTSYEPPLAISGPGDGTFVVVWTSDDYDGYAYPAPANDIMAARFGVGTVGCSSEPLTTCREPTIEGRGDLRFRDSTNDTRDSLTWLWTKGEATSSAELGDPFTGAAYAFCIYDGSAASQPLLAIESTAAGLCRQAPCWKPYNGNVIEYFDYGHVAGGLERIRLVPGDFGKARVMVRALGVNLDLPPLPLAAGVTVQLQGTHGTCWSATYTSAGIRKNGDGVFVAKPAAGSPSAAFLDFRAGALD